MRAIFKNGIKPYPLYKDKLIILRDKVAKAAKRCHEVPFDFDRIVKYLVYMKKITNQISFILRHLDARVDKIKEFEENPRLSSSTRAMLERWRTRLINIRQKAMSTVWDETILAEVYQVNSCRIHDYCFKQDVYTHTASCQHYFFF